MVSLSQRTWWALGAVGLGAGLGFLWAVRPVNEAEVAPVAPVAPEVEQGSLPPAPEVERGGRRPTLVPLPGGRFVMGSPAPAQPDNAEHERPQHLVEVPAFSLSETEVTQGQYKAVTGENPSKCEVGCGDELPVHSVTWFDAVAYLNKLTVMESEALVASGQAALTACYEGSGEDLVWVPECTGYRLPTEAEWEYAARAGTTTSWSFGEMDPETAEDPADIGEHVWHSGNSGHKVHAVGTKRPNPWGLYDLHGNVWEWVWDAFDSYQDGRVVNSAGPRRVYRGGAFNASSDFHRSAYRGAGRPVFHGGYFGFRCARGPGPRR